MNTLSILDHTGDTCLTWDASDPASVESMRATVETLKQQGYSFFLVDGRPADAVTAGAGTLIIRKLQAQEVTEAPEAVAAPEPVPEPPAEPVEAPRRRGRPRKHVVAVRPMAGG